MLGNGDVSAKLFVLADAFTRSAREKIEAAGGTAQVIEIPSSPLAALGVDVPTDEAADKPAKPARAPRAPKASAKAETADAGTADADAPAADAAEPVAEAAAAADAEAGTPAEADEADAADNG